MEKNERNDLILSLHNQGESIKAIADKLGMSKGGVHKVLNGVLVKDYDVVVDEKKTTDIVSDKYPRGSVLGSFVGLKRIGVNEYVDEKTGEVVMVRFNKATLVGGFGTFSVI